MEKIPVSEEGEQESKKQLSGWRKFVAVGVAGLASLASTGESAEGADKPTTESTTHESVENKPSLLSVETMSEEQVDELLKQEHIKHRNDEVLHYHKGRTVAIYGAEKGATVHIIEGADGNTYVGICIDPIPDHTVEGQGSSGREEKKIAEDAVESVKSDSSDAIQKWAATGIEGMGFMVFTYILEAQ